MSVKTAAATRPRGIDIPRASLHGAEQDVVDVDVVVVVTTARGAKQQGSRARLPATPRRPPPLDHTQARPQTCSPSAALRITRPGALLRHAGGRRRRGGGADAPAAAPSASAAGPHGGVTPASAPSLGTAAVTLGPNAATQGPSPALIPGSPPPPPAAAEVKAAVVIDLGEGFSVVLSTDTDPWVGPLAGVQRGDAAAAAPRDVADADAHGAEPHGTAAAAVAVAATEAATATAAAAAAAAGTWSPAAGGAEVTVQSRERSRDGQGGPSEAAAAPHGDTVPPAAASPPAASGSARADGVTAGAAAAAAADNDTTAATRGSVAGGRSAHLPAASATSDSGDTRVDDQEADDRRRQRLHPFAPAAAAAAADSPTAAVGAAGPSLEARKELTRSLRAAVTWRQLRELLAAHGSSLDGRHLVTAARRLRDVAPQPGRRVVREQALFRSFLGGFMELCRHFLPSLDPVPLAGVLYALAALRCAPPDAWMVAWLAAAEQRLRQFRPQEIANTAHALGQLSYSPGEVWLERLCAAAAAAVTASRRVPVAVAAASGGDGDGSAGGSSDDVLSEDVAVIRLRREGHDGEGALLGVDTVQTSEGQTVSTVGSATLENRVTVVSCVNSMGDAAREDGKERRTVPEPADGFTAQGLSQLIWGLARLSYSPPTPYMEALCTETLHQLPNFTAAGLANALWGLTTLRYRPADPWVGAAAAACLQLMPTATAYDMSISIWGLMRLGYTPDRDWLAGFLSASYSELPSASPEQSARMLWGLAKVGLTPPTDWMRRWLSLSYVRLPEADSTTLTTMMWALATLGIRPRDKWVGALLVAAWEQPLRSFAPYDLAMLLWGLARCRATPEEAWMDEFWSVSYKRLPVMPARHLALLVHSCVVLGQAPSGRWLAGHEQLTAARMDEQTAEGLSLLAYSYGMLERTPSREWFLALYDGAARYGFADFDAMGLERLIWGIAKMDPPPELRPDAAAATSPGWMQAFLEQCAVHMHDMSYCNLANLLFALALLGVRPGEAWLTAAAARVEALVEEFGQTTAAKVLWALPRLRNPQEQGGSGEDGVVVVVGGGIGRGAALEGGTARVERLLEGRMRRMMRSAWVAPHRGPRPGPRRGA